MRRVQQVTGWIAAWVLVMVGALGGRLVAAEAPGPAAKMLVECRSGSMLESQFLMAKGPGSLEVLEFFRLSMGWVVPRTLRHRPMELEALGKALAADRGMRATWCNGGRCLVLDWPLPDAEFQRIQADLASTDLAVIDDALWRCGRPTDLRLLNLLVETAQDSKRPAVAQKARARLEDCWWDVGKMVGPKAVPLLLQALAAAKTGKSQRPLMYALADVGGDAARSGIEKYLDDPEETTRQIALAALAFMHDAKALPAIRKLLTAKEVQTRADAIRTLGFTGDAKNVAEIEAFLTAQEPEIRCAAVGGLAYLLRDKAKAHLEKMAQDPDPSVREDVAYRVDCLGAAGNTLAVKLLADTDAKVCSAAADMLNRIGTAADLPALGKALATENPQVKCSLLAAIGGIGDKAGLPLIEPSLGDMALNVRQMAAEAVGSIGGPEAAAVMQRAMKNADPAVRKSLVRGLSLLGEPESMALLEQALGDRDKMVRAEAAHVLEGSHSDGAMKLLALALLDEDPEVVGNAVTSLCFQPNPKALKMLQTLATGKDQEQVRLVMTRMADLGGDRALDLAAQVFANTDEKTRMMAMMVLGDSSFVGSRRALALLSQGLGDTAPLVRIVALESITHSGTEAARDLALAQVVKETVPYVREDMIRALQKQWPADAKVKAALEKLPQP